MQGTETRLDLLDNMVSDAVRRGIAQQTTEDHTLDGRRIRLAGRDLVNFASCSYLGLETDPRLRAGTIDAVTRYGTQFSSSRVYVSAPPYAELEEQLSRIFAHPAVATPSTTLGHLCAIPTLVDERDAVILDHQVHHSVQTATTQVAAAGARVEMLRHSRMDLLEERIAALSQKHRQVWYMADGVYSMYGDLAPFEHLSELLDRYEQFHLYVDDAHGMSWHGERGSGVTLSRMEMHPRMVMATSMNKSFAAGGGVLVFPDEETRRRVRTCGGPLLFSGPIQPPMLGAAIASARIHLSDEIGGLQDRLRRKVALCSDLLASHDFPVLSNGDSPVQFVGMGLTAVAQNMVARLMGEGFYTNVGQFPAVPIKKAGVRFTITLHQTEEDIAGLVAAIAHHHRLALEEEGEGAEGAWEAFSMRPRRPSSQAIAPPVRSGEYVLHRGDSISQIDADDWNACLGDRGAFDVAGLSFLESTFHQHRERREDRWRFRYYQVKDRDGRTRLSTFTTEALWKADMLASEEVSLAVEESRKQDPYELTLRTVSLGSLLTEGDHLFLDRSDPKWRDALSMVLAAISEDASDADMIALRDLPAHDTEMDEFLRERGFAKTPGPSSMVVPLTPQTDEEFVASLGRKHRYHLRRYVLPFIDAYDVEILGDRGRSLTSAENEHLFGLYQNVRAQNLELNAFPLPEDVFERMSRDPSWELALFRLRPEFGDLGPRPVGFGATFIGRAHHVPTVVGLDYRAVERFGLYRQCLRHFVVRGRQLGVERVHLGIGAPLEKRRFGAHEVETALYIQAKDHYAFDAVAQLAQGGTR